MDKNKRMRKESPQPPPQPPPSPGEEEEEEKESEEEEEEEEEDEQERRGGRWRRRSAAPQEQEEQQQQQQRLPVLRKIPPKKKQRCLFWVDCETCSLDPSSPLLEIAVVLTDSDLQELDSATFVVHQPHWLVQSALSGWSRETHHANGLLREVAESPWRLRSAQDAILRMMDRFDDIRDGRWIPAGSKVTFDMEVIRFSMPRLSQRLFYRPFDVSVILIAMDLFAPGDEEDGDAAEQETPSPPPAAAVRSAKELSPPKRENSHRAEGDIRDSLRLGRHYRTHLFGKPALVGPEDQQ